MLKRALLLLSFTIISILTLSAETFKFSYQQGDRYRILSRVDEWVYINKNFSHRADILNKITDEVAEVDGGRAFIKSNFQTSERNTGSEGVFKFSTEYYSEFYRNELGLYEIGSDYYMPVVRDVPVFPEQDLQPGDSWSARAEEVHDFRKLLRIEKPFRIPIYVNYTYLGKRTFEDVEYDAISVKYSIFYRPREAGPGLIPALIAGNSNQVVYWDAAQGRPAAYEEGFDFRIELPGGDVLEYSGSAESKILDSPQMDKPAVAEDIRKDIEDRGVADTEVNVSDEGVMITLSNINFEADSFVLLPSEQQKLRHIADILCEYPERDVVVEGHTALAGTREGRRQLSEQRAAAVADYLLQHGCRSPEQIIMRGAGADKPVAANDTAEGMRKNRRVEITILEN